MAASNALGFAPAQSIAASLAAVANSPYAGNIFSGAPADQSFQGDVDVAGTVTGQYGKFISQIGGGSLILTATTDSCAGTNVSGVLDVLALGARTPTDYCGLKVSAGQSNSLTLQANDSSLLQPPVTINYLKAGPAAGTVYTVTNGGTILAPAPTPPLAPFNEFGAFVVKIEGGAPQANYSGYLQIPTGSVSLTAVVVVSPNSTASYDFESMYGSIEPQDAQPIPNVGTFVYFEATLPPATGNVYLNVRVIQ